MHVYQEMLWLMITVLCTTINTSFSENSKVSQVSITKVFILNIPQIRALQLNLFIKVEGIKC